MRRRRVFYIPGYDPFHARRYRELYRSEGAAQAEISGYELTVAGRPGAEVYGWDVAARIEGARVETGVEVLGWSDIVRASMGGGIAATYLMMLRTAWVYISTGALFRLARLRKGPLIAALYPVGFLLVQLALALVVGVLAGFGAGTATEWAVNLYTGPEDGALLGALAAVLAAPLVAWLVLRWFRAMDGRLYAYYLMHDYGFAARWRGANPPELEARIAVFADTIAAAQADGVDEVLVVGHSSGAHLAVSVLADLLRSGRAGPTLSFLSLGQAIPMISFLPNANRLRADLRLMSEQDTIPWIDVTAPGDGCSYALCDPVSVSGVAGPAKHWPLVLSAAFTQTLKPETWARLKRRFFRLHFQYLCAFDNPGAYDYFRITAGPQRLAERFAGRAPSASRIETPLSAYRDRAA